MALGLILGLFIYGVARLPSAKDTYDPILRKEIIEVPNGYGYKIFSGDKLLIQQEFIPAVKGDIAFGTKKDARKVANLVIEKIRNRTSPQISVEELEALGIVTSDAHNP